jgi:hypothetical protein
MEKSVSSISTTSKITPRRFGGDRWSATNMTVALLQVRRLDAGQQKPASIPRELGRRRSQVNETVTP